MSSAVDGGSGDFWPKQARSRETLSRLLDAAEAVLGKEGVEAATVPAIAERAGASVGAVYRRFPDKDALLRAVCERFLERVDAANAASLQPELCAGVPAAALAGRTVHAVVTGYRMKAGMLRAVHLFAAQHPDPAFRKRVEEQSARTLDRIVEMFRPVFGQIRHEDPELALRAGLLAVTLAMRQLVVTGKPLQASLRVPQASLESELQRMFLRYLGLE
jgi:AcrR family transcriptional regulator